MSLEIDSLVSDLIFQSDMELEPEKLVEVLGGQDELAKLQVLDPDMQDPRFEMELSPSMPFRRRGERRLMLVDASVAPMRENPREDTYIPLDLRPYKEKLVAVAKELPIRFARLFALGGWGDALWIGRSYRDLRGICLIGWALDPTIDIEGRRRATPLGQHEFEEKLMSYEKRLDELDEEQIKARIQSFEPSGLSLVEEDGLIIVSLLDEKGGWNVKDSLELEAKCAAVELFSAFPGAKNTSAERSDSPAPQQTPPEAKKASVPEESENALAPTPQPELPADEGTNEILPLVTAKVGDKLVLFFPQERFDLSVAASLGKKDWDSVLNATDPIQGADKDLLFRQGAEFVAPIDFLSEVFLDGKPLNKPLFEEHAVEHAGGVKSMEVHFPRFGPVLLMAKPDGSRLVSSWREQPESLIAALP